MLLAIALTITAIALVIGIVLLIAWFIRKPPNKVYPEQELKGEVILDEVEEDSWHPKYDYMN
jgi:flagellar basal body-associated protein FliL